MTSEQLSSAMQHLEQHMDERLADICETNAKQIKALQNGQREILEMLRGYHQNAATFATIAEKLKVDVTQLQDAYRANHGRDSLPPAEPTFDRDSSA